MADTTFTDGQGTIISAWLNDVNRQTYGFTSVAAFRAASFSVNLLHVFIRGYYTAGDGGGGWYRYDPADVTSSDNGGSTLVSADGKRVKLQWRDYVSVMQFGAKGDGTTDDTAAIQSAINYVQLNTNTGTYGSGSPAKGPGALFIPQGYFKLTDALLIGYKISIFGEGQTEFSYGSRIFQSVVNKDLFKFDPTTGGGSLSLEKLVLVNTAGVGTGHLVNVTRTAAPYVNSQRYVACTFGQPQAKALLLTGDDIVIENCLFDVSQQSGDMIQLGTAAAGGTCTNVRITANDFFNATNSVVKILNCAGLSFTGNIVSQPNNTTKTPYIIDAITTTPTDAESITISGNTIRGARTFFGGASVNNVEISGNSVVESGIAAGETLHMFKFTGTCVGINICNNVLRGNYDTVNFYNDASAGAVSGCISSNNFQADGGTGDALACTKFTGRLLSNYFAGFTNKQMGQKWNTTGAPVNPGAIASGATFGYTTTVKGALIGDTVSVGTISNAWIAQTGIDVRAFTNAADTPRVEYRNVTTGSITVPAHDIWLEVTR